VELAACDALICKGHPEPTLEGVVYQHCTSIPGFILVHLRWVGGGVHNFGDCLVARLVNAQVHLQPEEEHPGMLLAEPMWRVMPG
jgi:hypothetical protein